MTGTQAWMWRSWLVTPIWLWISINTGAIIADLLLCASIFYIFLYLFPNALSIFLFILIAIVALTVPLSLIQWLMLRQQVIFPALWSTANAIIGLLSYVLLPIVVSFNVYNSWQYLVFSMFTGAITGLLSSILINTWGRP
ncbi:MAG: hypothetical protein QNJ34_09960 [Xenococcaceae cyanobacterium MO_188.B29]|nr:hypothetical protein [Xenococcaceae cyanobacterium MO_188.B29]